ncbi:MAG: RNA 2',3'-cyclic phosphodiesterase [Acidobacteria bacterium]|nr:RNA 2',3'-cyclic phosphodiesterase [Acidobacteriota bacterium]
MRLFTALDISAETRAALLALLRELRPLARFQWSRPENLHITTKFIGDCSDLNALKTALRGVPRPGAITVRIGGLGWFPNPHSPRVLFAGMQTGPELEKLHRDTDAACAAIGIPGEEKKFNPHLTLARIKSPDGLREVRGRIAQLPGTEFGEFTARSFHLYESVPGPRGSQYVKLEEFPLL